MANFHYIDVVDTAVICGLTVKPNTLNRSEVQAKCPFCDDQKYRMYLSQSNDSPATGAPGTYFCHNCGNGGNAVTLYARVFNTSAKQAYIDLMKNPQVKKDAPDTPTNTIRPIKPLKQRSEIYLALLNMLSLSEKHRKNLRERGLSDKIINGNMYRSMPETSWERESIADKLAEQFDLTDMPGFFTKKCTWRLYGKPGILIPVCTKDNLIQGLQIRLDKDTEKKFVWLSTNGFKNGTKINGYIHVTGDTDSDTLGITEGPLKADIASCLAGGTLFIGLTGVNATMYLEDILKELKPRKIVECLDIDKFTNEQVMKAMNKIQSIAMPLCEEYKPFYWSKTYKGIDDYLLHRSKLRKAI